MLRISVAICTHNRATVLRKALRSLESQTLPTEEFEVLVIDNASSDETPAVLKEEARRRSNIRSIREERLGQSVARNTAARIAASPYIAYLDDDAQASPEWLEALLDAFENRSPVPACVGGTITLDWDGGNAPPWVPQKYESLYSGLDLGGTGHFLSGPKDYLVGANIAFRVEEIRKHGGFDEGLGRKGTLLLSGEETAVVNRFRELGLPLYYEPRAAVSHFVHPERRTRKWLVRRVYWDGAAQPLLDYGKGKARRFYIRHAFRDSRQLAELGISLPVAVVGRNSAKLASAGLDFIQRLGRLRTNILLLATGGR